MITGRTRLDTKMRVFAITILLTEVARAVAFAQHTSMLLIRGISPYSRGLSLGIYILLLGLLSCISYI